MTTSSFPLLKLPQKSILTFLGCLNPLEQLTISFCSKLTLKLVKSLKVPVKTMALSAGNIFKINCYFSNRTMILIEFHGLSFLDESEKKNLTNFKDHIRVVFKIITSPEVQEVCNLQEKNYGVRDYIDHFLSVFNHRFELEILSDYFQIDSIQDTLKGLNINRLKVEPEVPKAYFQQLMKGLGPFETLTAGNNSLEEPEDGVFLCGNYHFLELNVLVTLDQLLVANSTQSLAMFGLLSDESLNRFVKFWISGSHRRLRYVHFFDHTENGILNVNEIMKGIRNKPMVPDDVRRFKVGIDNYREYIEGKHGFDIRRKDGVKATVMCSSDMGLNRFFLFVWP